VRDKNPMDVPEMDIGIIYQNRSESLKKVQSSEQLYVILHHTCVAHKIMLNFQIYPKISRG
jgi:hypothetical protein